MYQVKIIEKINGQLAVRMHSFDIEGEMKQFVKLCRKNHALVFVQKLKEE